MAAPEVISSVKYQYNMKRSLYMCIFSYTRQNFGNDTSDDDPEENESKIYGHEEIIVRSSFATFLQKMIPQFESEVSRDFFLHINDYNCCLACLLLKFSFIL